jgi:hypothetical protein
MARILRFLFLAHLLLAANAFAASTPSHLWSRGAGGIGTINPDAGYSVAVDAFRNVIIVGQFDGTANFGGADLNGLANDIFIAKYSPTGVHLWSKKFGSAGGTDVAFGVATDPSGNIFVTGYFNNTVDFGNGIGLVSAGGIDAFIAKYAPNGATLWSRRMGAGGTDVSLSVTVDPSTGNPVIAGYFVGNSDFGGGALVNAGSNDIVVAKYDGNSGAHTWSKGLGSTGTDIGNSVAVDASGNVVVTGYFNNTVNFGGAGLVSAGGDEIFVAKYNSSGTHQWSQRFGSTGSDQGSAVAVDASGNVVVGGQFNNTVNFGGSNLVSAGFADAFLAKYNSSGTHQWSQRFGDGSGEGALAVATDASGNVAVTGFFGNTINMGGGTLTTTGLGDGFLAKFNSSGVHQWSRKIGGTSNDDGRGVAMDAGGNIVNTGRFQLGADFGGGGVWSNGGFDAYIVKYGPKTAEPVITSIADIGNDQGRRVTIKFSGSGGDNADAATPITNYEAYRRDNAPPAVALRAAGPEGLSRRQLLDSGWTFAGSVPAHQQTSYGIDAPTIGDSTITLGQYYSVFFIRGASETVNTFYDSPIDSGYSVDNLAPAVPQNFVFNGGGLSWKESTAADFDYFTVYGSDTDSFGAATVVDYSIAPSMDVTSSPYVLYYVTATDFSGNEGKPAKVNTLSTVGGTPKNYVLSVSNYPNPFNPRTTVSYTVPSRGHVTVSVYDAHGTHVATLFDGERNAGTYSVEWEGRAAGASVVASGIYFARIDHASGTRSKKMVLLK